MPAYIVFIREVALDELEVGPYCSKVPTTLGRVPISVQSPKRRRVTLEEPGITRVVVAELASHKRARTRYESLAHQDPALRRLDSWLADMEYCDRF